MNHVSPDGHSPDTPTDPVQRLRTAERALAERARLERRLTHCEENLQQRKNEEQRALVLAAAEETDVYRLEHMSVGRIWSSLRGTRGADLDRERAEAAQTRYEAERARSMTDRSRRERDDVAAALAALGDTQKEYEASLAAVAESDEPDLRSQADDARSRLSRIRELRELAEADAAGEVALAELTKARTLLAKADDWSAWDTWFDGGAFTSYMKHERLNDVQKHLASAAEHLERFSHELADVELPSVSAPDIDTLTRNLDIWFDNFFTDFAVRRRIKDARASLEESVDAVKRALTEVRARRAALE